QHNADRIFMGHDPVPLAPEGKEQIRRLGARLRGRRIDRIVASDIFRVQESADILSEALGRSYEMHEALREVDVGDAKGVSYADAAKRWPEVFDPGGEGRFPRGESFADVADRASAFLREAVIRDEPATVLVVTHGGVVRGAGARLLGLSLRAIGPFAVDNGSLTVLRVEGPGTWCLTWNDTAHLDAEGTTGRSAGG
ncbi:MAG: histidine phosphatase family protein, partial [Candidatus Binatia bacterium]